MRQIVQTSRPIVPSKQTKARQPTAVNGTAEATLWHGQTQWVDWSLASAIGYFMPLKTEVEVACKLGVTNVVRPGELLVINRGESAEVGLQLRGQKRPGRDAVAVIGHLRLRTPAESFGAMPQRAMTVVRLTAQECVRSATLAQMVANERGGTSEMRETRETRETSTLLNHLQRALFESFAEVLCACDPLGLPEFAAMTDARLCRALRAMIAEPARAWRLDTLAREAALSRTLFATRFKLVLGITPLDYLTQLRVQLAATLKAEAPNRTMHDLAAAVGYADESSLRRAMARVGNIG